MKGCKQALVKQISFFIVVIITVAFFSACSNNDSTQHVKQNIVIATMSGSNDLQGLVERFNINNEEYQIVIQQYYDRSGEMTRADAVARLNSDITSNNCPDIIDLTGLDVVALAEKGVFEDLNTYLDKSYMLDQENFLESILNAYTYDGCLVAIPYRFSIQTAVASAAEIDATKGWTIEEVIAYTEDRPNAVLFDGIDKSFIMQYLMRFNEDLFIDWTSGECYFDSEEFKQLLQFVYSFPDETKSDVNALPGPLRIQNGEVLLATEYMINLNSVQVYKEMFQGDVLYVGYPTVDGGYGHIITSAQQIYGITTKSSNKEGAWQFIESVLTQEKSDRLKTGFPSSISNLEAEIGEVLNSGYVLDENGELLLDENGDPIINTDFDTISFGYLNGSNIGWTYTYRPPTQEEIDILLNVLNEARLISESNEDIMNIINEETEAYFSGQKGLDRTVEIIQNRITLYLQESM